MNAEELEDRKHFIQMRTITQVHWSFAFEGYTKGKEWKGDNWEEYLIDKAEQKRQEKIIEDMDEKQLKKYYHNWLKQNTPRRL